MTTRQLFSSLFAVAFLLGCSEDKSSVDTESTSITGDDVEVYIPTQNETPLVPDEDSIDDGHILSNEMEMLKQSRQLEGMLQENEAKKQDALKNLDSEY